MDNNERLRGIFIQAHKDARTADAEAVDQCRVFVNSLRGYVGLGLTEAPDMAPGRRVVGERYAIDREGVLHCKVSASFVFTGFDLRITNHESITLNTTVTIELHRSGQTWIAHIDGQQFGIVAPVQIQAAGNVILRSFEEQLSAAAWNPFSS